MQRAEWLTSLECGTLGWAVACWMRLPPRPLDSPERYGPALTQ